MPIILAAFCLFPLLAGAIVQYIVCRRSRRWYLRALPPVLVVGVAVLIGVGRWRIWASATVSPLTQILFFPGLPALFLLVGLLCGWRIWRRWWRPRVVKDK